MKTVTLEDQGIERITGLCEHVMERPRRKLRPAENGWQKPKALRSHGPNWRTPCPNRATVRAANGKRYCKQHAPLVGQHQD